MIYTLLRYPRHYAQAQQDQGTAFRLWIGGERRKNLEQAITCFQEALRLCTVEDYPYVTGRIKRGRQESTQRCSGGSRHTLRTL